MTPTSSIAPAASPTGGAAAAKAATALTDGASEDRFLTLLVAQLKNQDPLNPLDNAQVTSQLAQISTVSGIDRLNATLKAMAGSVADSQPLQAAAMIGRDVLVPGNSLALAGGEARGGFELAGAADGVTLEIRDPAGNLVHRAELGAQSAGLHYFAWDGIDDRGAAAPPGAYVFTVSARRSGDEVKADPLAAARVLGVVREADGTSLELSGIGRRRYTEVREIL